MTGFYKKLMATGMALSMGLSSYGVADSGYSCAPASCPSPCDPCGPCGSWCDNICFEASLLWWKLGGDEFDYVAEKEGRATGSPNDHFGYDQRVHDVSFNTDPGFRFALGGSFPCFCFDWDVAWTHLDTSGSNKTELTPRADPEVVSYSIPSLPDSGEAVGPTLSDNFEFRGHVKFHYDTVDLEVSKWCCCNSCLKIRPHVGIRFADIREKFSVSGDYNFTDVGSPPIGPVASEEFRVSNTFKGAGVRAGLDTNFRLCDGWSLVGRFAQSVVWGSTNIRSTYEAIGRTSSFEFDGVTRENYKHCRAFTDLAFGLRYDTCCCSCPIFLEADWEFHYLWSQHRFFVDRFYNEYDLSGVEWKKNGNACLQGLTLTLGICF